MKKINPYFRITLFLLILLLILGINSFIYNFLSNYYMIAFLLIILVIFKIFFGFEKDRHRYIKDIIIDLFINLLTFFILYYLLGIIITFARTPNYYSWYGFINFILRIILFIVLREILRYQILNKCDGSKIATILSIFCFVFLDITNNFYFYNFESKYNIFIFLALYLLPSLSNNLLATYLTKKVGYKPVIFFMMFMTLYAYLLPIIPNPNKYISSVINFVFPLIILYKEYNFFKKESDEEIERHYNKVNISFLVISLVITIILVYFTSGYFHYHAIAVASGSMSPLIDKGDVVVIEKIDNKYDSLKIGDVIAFEYSNVIIVHRIINIVHDRGEYFFYTKGDANENDDNFVVNGNMVEGIVNNKIPFIGLPTVWLNEL